MPGNDHMTGPAPSRRKDQMEAWTARAIDANDFSGYRTSIIHDWLRTLTALAVVLVPLFFVLDVFMMPSGLLPRFAIYRLISTVLALAQFLIVRNTQPSRWSYLHGYFISLQVGEIIALMTVDLGGFNSTYYAGLTLVIIGVNLLMPWRAMHTAVNTLIILAMYVTFNLVSGQPFDQPKATNNFFFLISTAVLAVSINYVRYNLIEKEFSLLVKLKKARDALWGEMELAKRIQTALLPQRKGGIRGYESAVTMLPAKEVGGDYYDIIETDAGDRWVAIGDVAGHGVDSGLIMMMAQASIMTVIKGNPARPAPGRAFHHESRHQGRHRPAGFQSLHDDDGGEAPGRLHDRGRASPGCPGLPFVPERRNGNSDQGNMAGHHGPDRVVHGSQENRHRRQ